MLKQSKNFLLPVGFLSFAGLLLYILSPVEGHPFDTWCWIAWSRYIFENGLSNVYNSKTDYLPLYHYVLYFYGIIEGSVHNITNHIHRLKIVTLLFEAGSALFLFHLLREKFKDTYKALVYSLFYFCNLAVLFNSLVWGQVDGIFTFFIFVSVITAYEKHFFPAILCFVLAVNMKLQAIIFFPLVVALILPAMQKAGSRKVLISISAVLLIQLLIILPFLLNGNTEGLIKTVTGAVGRYPVISLNAYNIWFLMFDGDLRTTEDTVSFAGLTYMRWGQLAFIITGFASLYYLIKPNFLFLFGKQPFDISRRKVLITASLIPLLFFFFNTQMHERYTHPAIIFIAAYSLLYHRPFPLIIVSIAYFLNLEDVYQFMNSHNYHTLIFSSEFIASLYALVIVSLFLDLYGVNPAVTLRKHLNKSAQVTSKTL